MKIAGTGKDLDRLKLLANELGISKQVTFLGFVPNHNLHQYRDEAHLIIVPSIFQEPFGIVGIEAMAHARAVVAHNVGGISQWLRDNENGYLIESKNIQMLADKIKKLLDNSELMNQMGAAGRRRAEQEFSAQGHIAALLQELNSVILKNEKNF